MSTDIIDNADIQTEEQTEDEVNKIIPSFLENKFADFTYIFAEHIPMGVAPNTITAVGLLSGMAGSVFIVLSVFHRWFLIFSVLGVFIHLICDNFDGWIARNRNMCSDRGGYFDIMSDIVNCTFAVICLALSPYANAEIMIWIVPLYGTQLVTTMHYIMHFNEFPFPNIGPFEVHCSLILLLLISMFRGPVHLFTLGGLSVTLVDAVMAGGGIVTVAEQMSMGFSLFFRLKKLGR